MFPQASNDSYVLLQARPEHPLLNFTVCLRSYTDLTRPHSLFSYATKEQDNEILLLKFKPTEYHFYVGGKYVAFHIPENYMDPEHVCVTWESPSGIVRFWLNGRPWRGRRGGQAGPGPRFEAMVEPPNFSWVAEGRLAGLGMPREPGHYRFLLGRGVKHLVSLSERPPPHHGCCPAVQLHRFRVPDFTPPTARQIQSFLQLVEEANGRGEAVAVHCMLGHGRTGTMLACYLVKTQKMSGSDAIREIRRLRPGSIETREQEQAVMEFHRRFSAGEDSREA